MDRFQIEALCFGVTEEFNIIYWSTGIVLVLDQYQHYYWYYWYMVCVVVTVLAIALVESSATEILLR